MIGMNDLKETEKGVKAYKKLKTESDHVLQVRLKTRIRTMVGLCSVTRGEGFKSNIENISKENWKVGWARLYEYSFNDEFSEWLIKIGLDMFIVTANKKEREIAYKVLTGIYLN